MNYLKKIEKVIEFFPFCVTLVNVKEKTRPCISVNKYFTESTGYLPSEVIGKNLAFLQGERTEVETILFMRKCFEKEEACIQDLINYKKDGTVFVNRLLLIPFYKKNDLLIYMGIQNDITEKISSSVDNKKLEKVRDSEIKHTIGNSLAIVLGKLVQAIDHKSEIEFEGLVKDFSERIKQMNNFALNIENMSEFENFKYLGGDM